MKIGTYPYAENFLKYLANYVKSILPKDPCIHSQTLIILPTKRACLEFEKELVKQYYPKSFILPQIRSINSWSQSKDSTTKIISPLQRHLLLSHLVQAQTKLSWTSCFSLASSLIYLLDQFYLNDISFNCLETLVPADLSEHWQKNLDVLKILGHQWPQKLKDLNLEDSYTARAKALAQQEAEWKKYSPQAPIIAAGISGSIPAINRFLSTIYTLDQGKIILLGSAQTLSTETWQDLASYHPYYDHKKLLESLGVLVEDLKSLSSHRITSSKREFFLQYLFNAEGLEKEKIDSIISNDLTVLENIELLEANSLQEEARLISLIIRQNLETSSFNIALVTPHRGLCDRVTAELKRWKIVPNDPYGDSLFDSSHGAFLLLSLNYALHPDDPITVLSLLKHPFTLLGFHPSECRQKSRQWERQYIRPLSPFDKFSKIVIQDSDLKDFHQKIHQAIAPLNFSLASLSEWIQRHIESLEALSFTEDPQYKWLWGEESGKETFALLEELKNFSSQQVFTLNEYRVLLTLHLKKKRITHSYGMHARVHILNPLQARLLHFDLIILGGMNDAHWSDSSSENPWLSQSMKKKLGFITEAIHVGLMANDWLYLMNRSRIIITRTQREAGIALLPSRWLMRLKAVLQHHFPEKLDYSFDPWYSWSKILDQQNQSPKPSIRPAPCPEVHLRPRQLSISEVDLWQQDPYAIYAKKILHLNPLPSIEKEISGAAFGTVIHRALDNYMQKLKKGISGGPFHHHEILLKEGYYAFGLSLDHLIIKSLWWPRFVRIADWFLQEQKQRASSLQSFWTELKGEWVFEGLQGAFILKAKADRLDLSKQGQLEIIDYKTGMVPTRLALIEGKSLQLALEGAIARYGSWRSLHTNSLKALSFWQLKGGLPAGKIISFENIDLLVENAVENLKQLVFLYDHQTTPYLANGHASNDYDLLARRAEWRLLKSILVS